MHICTHLWERGCSCPQRSETLGCSEYLCTVWFECLEKQYALNDWAISPDLCTVLFWALMWVFFSRIMENLLVPVSLAWKLKVSDNQMSPKSLWVTDFPVHCLRINKNKKGEQEVSRREKVVLFRKSGKAPEGELSQERGFCLVSCPLALVSFIMGIWWRPRYHYWDWAIFDHHLTDWISKGPSHPVLFSLAQPERWSCIACSVRGVVICHGHACLLSLNSFYMLHRLWWHHLSFLFPGYITHLWFTGDPCPLLLPACGEPSPVSTHF